MAPVMARLMRMEVTVPSMARFSLWAPIFCATKVVAAIAMERTDSMMNWSSLL